MNSKMAKNYDFFIENEYRDFDESLVESCIPSIFEELFKIKRIGREFPYSFDTLTFDIIFCNDEKIRTINKAYRFKDEPTDVITFSLFSDDENKFIHNNTIDLGEIIISIERAEVQAQEQGHSIKKEVLTLLTHGILHLLGFDHMSNMDYNFVIESQNLVLESLGE